MFERVRALSRIFGIIGMNIMMPLVFLTTVDVILRIFFHSPILGAHEITGFMLVILVFFSLAYTLYEKGHTVIDLVVEKLPKKLGAVLVTIGYFFSAIIFGLITWQTTNYGFEKLHYGIRVSTMPLLVFPFVFIAALGCALLTIALLLHFINSFKDWRRTNE